MSLKAEIYDSSKRTLEFIELELNMAGIDPRHPLRNITLATLSDWGPEARSVVLRRFDRKERKAFFHTHSGSKKMAELSQNSKASLVGYNAEKDYQVRLRGTCTFHQQDELAKEIWVKTPMHSRKEYLLRESPGSFTDFPTSSLPPHLETGAPAPEESEQGFSKFVVCSFLVKQIDWLYLGDHGHRRCLFTIADDGKTQAQWLVP